MQENINQLIKACKKGNQVAQMQLYDQYSQAMFTIACRYLINIEDAKDAMQEGFLKAFLNIEKFELKATFGSWLKRIIINQCLDIIKTQNLEFGNLDTELINITEENDWEFDQNITKLAITQAINRLDEKYKLVLNLYLIDGYDHQEISEILKIPVKTSRTHLSRGKSKLRVLLKPKYNEARY